MGNETFMVTRKGYFLKILNKYEAFSKDKYEEYYTFIYVLSGSADLEINQEEIHATQYDYFMLRKDDTYFLKALCADASLMTILVTPEEIHKLLEYMGAWFTLKIKDDKEVLTVSGDYNVKLKIDELYERLLRNGDDDKIISRLCVLEFVSGIMRKMHRRERQDEIPQNLIEAMKSLRAPENMCEGVKALERYTHYSRAQLCRLVKKYYNTTPQEYVTNLRLSFAYNMIVYSNIDVNTIAEMVGYNSMSYFYRAFKEKYNLLPSEIRK